MQSDQNKISLFLLLCFFIPTIFIPGDSKAKESAKETSREITIVDNGLYFKIKTNKSLVSEILLELGLSLNREDRIYPDPLEQAYDRIIIERATPITILADGKAKSFNTFQKTTGEVLADTGVILGPDDEINYRLSKFLFTDMEIIVTRVKFGTIKKSLPIPFQTINKKDNTLNWGTTKIAQEGRKGIKEESYQIVYRDGKENQRILQKEEILEKPQDKIILEGTKIVVGEAYRGVASFYRYGDKLTCAATKWPKGAILRVTNLQNNKQVIVTVNDYGPFVPGRIIDLNVPAFKKIAPLGTGVAQVKVEEIIQ